MYIAYLAGRPDERSPNSWEAPIWYVGVGHTAEQATAQVRTMFTRAEKNYAGDEEWNLIQTQHPARRLSLWVLHQTPDNQILHTIGEN